MKMDFKGIITLLLVILTVTLQAQNTSKKFDKAEFYDVIASEDIGKVDAELNILKEIQIPEKEAYEGTLLMKKAGLANGPGEKLHLFKSGHKKLEKAIENDKDNIEFRFLRLVIQENSPKMLGYKDQMEEDSQQISKFFKTLTPVVQKAVINYSKKSKVIKV